MNITINDYFGPVFNFILNVLGICVIWARMNHSQHYAFDGFITKSRLQAIYQDGKLVAEFCEEREKKKGD